MMTDEAIGKAQERYLRFCGAIQGHLWAAFSGRFPARDLKEAIHDGIALGWKRFLSLIAAGRSPEDFPFLFATRLARAVATGNSVVGQARLRNPLEPRVTHPRPDLGFRQVGAEQNVPGGIDPARLVADRLDYAAWIRGLKLADRRAAKLLALGHSDEETAMLLGREVRLIRRTRRILRVRWDHFRGRED